MSSGGEPNRSVDINQFELDCIRRIDRAYKQHYHDLSRTIGSMRSIFHPKATADQRWVYPLRAADDPARHIGWNQTTDDIHRALGAVVGSMKLRCVMIQGCIRDTFRWIEPCIGEVKDRSAGYGVKTPEQLHRDLAECETQYEEVRRQYRTCDARRSNPWLKSADEEWEEESDLGPDDKWVCSPSDIRAFIALTSETMTNVTMAHAEGIFSSLVLFLRNVTVPRFDPQTDNPMILMMQLLRSEDFVPGPVGLSSTPRTGPGPHIPTAVYGPTSRSFDRLEEHCVPPGRHHRTVANEVAPNGRTGVV